MQTTENFLPAATGQDLGSSTQQWDVYAQDITVYRDLSAQSYSNVRNASSFSGADLGAKVTAAIADLPSTGGIVDARGLEGAQTISSSLTLGSSTKPVVLLLGAATITLDAATINLTNGSQIIGTGTSRELGHGTAIQRTSGTATMISCVGTTGNGHLRNFCLRNFCLAGGGTNGHGIVLDYVDSFRLENVHCLNGGSANALRLLNEVWDFWIENCAFTIWGDATTYTIHMAGLDGSSQITDGHWFANQIGELTSSAPLLYANGFVLEQRFVDCKFHYSGGSMTHMVDWTGYRAAFIGCSFQDDTASSANGLFRARGADTALIGCHLFVTNGDAVHVIGTGGILAIGNIFRGIGSPAPGSGIVTESGATGEVTVGDNIFYNLTRGYDFRVGDNVFSISPSTFNGVTTPVDLAATSGGATWITYNVGHSAITSSSSIKSLSATAGVGYGTGAGGTQTQGTSKSTGVELNKVTGTITMHNAQLNAATSVGFTLTNSAIAATDVVVVSIKSGATADSYSVTVDATAAGSCRIQLRNVSGGNLSEAVVLSFVVIKGVAA